MPATVEDKEKMMMNEDSGKGSSWITVDLDVMPFSSIIQIVNENDYFC